MTTINTNVTSDWSKIADIADANLLATWDDTVILEVATTAADAAPTVRGHKLTRQDALTRSAIGPGYVWAKISPASGQAPAGIELVVSK